MQKFAPKVDENGNELGGVPVVLLDAPLEARYKDHARRCNRSPREP